MEKLREKMCNILVLLFFIHGVLYFFTPSTSYINSNPIKLLKYLIFVILIIIIGVEYNPEKRLKKVVLGCLILFTLSIIYIFANRGNNIGMLINYIVPMMIIFIIKDLMKYINLKTISIITYVFTSIVAYFNTYILKGVFRRWHVSGAYREVSIFINPNNFGIMIALLTIFFLLTYKKLWQNKKNILIFGLMMINSFLLIRMSGSNTGLIIFVITFIYCIFLLCKKINFTKENKRKYIFYGSIAIVLFCVIVIGSVFILNKAGNVRQISLQSTFIRLENYFEFVKTNINSLIFPYRNNCIFIDNIYLSIWGSFGLPIIICFIVYNVYLLKLTIKNKNTDEMFIIIVFMLIGITTNFLYLWPIGYLYWGITTLIINKYNTKKNSFRKMRWYFLE